MQFDLSEIPEKYREDIESYNKALKENRIDVKEYRQLCNDIKKQMEADILLSDTVQTARIQKGLDILVMMIKQAISSFV